MTLRVIGTLRWEPQGFVSRDLPVVLPVAILLVLAWHRRWMSRDEVAAQFWPELSDAAAALNLRVNLHKARRLLREFKISVAVEAERRRIRWCPSTDIEDIHGTHEEIAAGFALPGFERFEHWLRDWRKSGVRSSVRQTGSASPHADEGSTDDIAATASRFYGRRSELMRLRAFAASAIVVMGEAGIGKSRLVAEAFAPECWLRCRDGLHQTSFGAVTELFQSHPAWLENLGFYRLDVARLFPDLAPDEPLPPLDALTARMRLFEALARVIEQHARLLVVDDLQWADNATFEWLLLLARRGSVRWVATTRDAEMPPQMHGALATLEQKGDAAVLRLPGIARSALNALLHDRRPDLAAEHCYPQPHPWLDTMSRYTAGNPFCVIEVIDAVDAGDDPERLGQVALPERVASMLRRRRDKLPAPVRRVVDAAALAIGRPTVEQLAAMAGLGIARTIDALETGQRHGLLESTNCRHDLVREAVRAGISRERAAELHARAARYLVRHDADPEIIALHWRSAGDDAEAWPWVLRAAQRLRQRGERGAAAQALSELRALSQDAALALRAEVMMIQDRLFDDLPAGREGLESALIRAACISPGIDRQSIEAHALAGLHDIAVFSGDLEHALTIAGQLRERLPGLPPDALVEAHKTLIQATMRRGDLDAAWQSLHALRAARTPDAVLRSFEGQIHWFGGAVRESRAVFEEILVRHPDYCRGLTIENNLAVLYHALGELGTAEKMARRSLHSWAGVPHTEALSLLNLGTTLTSLGRFDDASQALAEAEKLGRQQGSTRFGGEALVRRARLHWCAGEHVAARRAALAARAEAGSVCEPLRGSNLALMEVLTAIGCGAEPDVAALSELEAYFASSRHPLVRARYWRAQAERARAGGDGRAAIDSARRQLAVAQEAGLLEWACEALTLIARCDSSASAEADRAGSLARAQEFAWLRTRNDDDAPRATSPA